MKKLLSFVLSLAVIFSGFAFGASASAATEQVEVLDIGGAVITTFDIDTSNARKGIQNAFDYVKNTGGDNIYTVKLAKATYSIFGSLDIYGNTTFDMNGSTIQRGDENCPALLRFGRGSETHYGYDGFKNVTVKNGTFDAKRLNNTSMVRFAHAQNVTFESVDFRNTVGTYHMLTFAACDNVVINNCGFYDMDTKGLNNAANGEALQIDILKEGHFTYPAQDATGTKNVKVTNCTFKNLGRGVGTHSAVSGHYFYNMEFSNNTFENIIGYAIKAVNYRNSKFNNNKIINCGSGIFIGNMTNRGCGNFYKAYASGDKIYKNANIEILNNTITLVDSDYGNLSYGIQLYGAKVSSGGEDKVTGDYCINKVTVSNNKISSSIAKKGHYGIWLQGVSGDEGDNTVSNNEFCYTASASKQVLYGMRVEESSGINLISNKIYDKNYDSPVINSALLLTGSDKVNVKGNQFSNTSAFGVKFYKVTNSVFDSNVVSGAKNNALYVYRGCNGFEITNNTISKTDGYGIVVSSASGKNITGNTVTGTKGYGIYLKETTKYSNVSKNYIYNIKSTGIYLNGSALATNINNNIIDITSQKKNGIQLNDSSSTKNIKNNQINMKKQSASKKLKVKAQNGIVINSKKCKLKLISGNKIKNIADKAIAVTAKNLKPTIKSNTITSCKYGIRYCKGKVVKNKIKKAKIAKIKKY